MQFESKFFKVEIEYFLADTGIRVDIDISYRGKLVGVDDNIFSVILARSIEAYIRTVCHTEFVVIESVEGQEEIHNLLTVRVLQLQDKS